ncbi:hypothetical protein [Azotobacter vinelandii]
MFYSRRLNRETGEIEVWECEWSSGAPGMSRKNFIQKVGNEGDQDFIDPSEYCVADAVCWAPGRTIGNIAVSSEEVFGQFSSTEGSDAVLPCHMVPCGKFRNGAKRWYCKTHQVHWGTLADLAAVPESGEISCSSHSMRMSYVVNPLQINFHEYEEIGIWCSLPAALSSRRIMKRPPKIHIHKRHAGDQTKTIDRDFNAVVCTYNQSLGLFNSSEITKIQVTPPAAFEFVHSLEHGLPVSCVSCKKCGYPHLDLGSFARTPHSKHFCGNCGNDSIWSSEAIVSSPLKPLHDQFNNSNTYIYPDRSIDLDSHEFRGLEFDIWASTPAVVWTANRPQEKGVHVHIYSPERGKILIDDTFSEVIYRGRPLSRTTLWNTMIEQTIY